MSEGIPAAAPPRQLPSIRLNLPAQKKRRYTPAVARLENNTASAAQLKAEHQSTLINFVWKQRPLEKQASWHAHGVSTIYVIQESTTDTTTNTTDTKSSTIVNLALNLRSTATVSNVQVSCLHGTELVPLQTLFHHVDPLQHVLVRQQQQPVAANTNYKFHADVHSSRGAVGMTNALRAASVASNLGELRISAVDTRDNQHQESLDETAWMRALTAPLDGSIPQQTLHDLHKRFGDRRARRLELVAQRLVSAKKNAFQITVTYEIPFASAQSHRAGIHTIAINNNGGPHVYTTSGTFGDHQGPRCWMPCLDSAACVHRCTQELTVTVTAPMNQGLIVLGAGENLGVSRAVLHDAGCDSERAVSELGAACVNLLRQTANTCKDTNVHIVPSDSAVESLESVQATLVWSSASWTPIPVRSLGFAIGPFKIIEDPEYFGSNAVVEDDDEEDKGSEIHQNYLDFARANGEGIRHAYFAPIFERKLTHLNASRALLPNTRIQVLPLTTHQRELAEKLDQTVICSTSGVPHRALSLMKDVLALPTFRSASYTQIWIPDAVSGGATSGSFYFCPEVSNNPFLGGAIMDSKLLPPPGSRLAYFQGGCILQFLQARTAIRGWIIAAMPLGGLDDVGNGYLHSLVESFIMSLYERGHGAHGEGGAKGGTLYNKRYAPNSGLNSANLDFLPVQNVEEDDTLVGGVRAVPIDDRHNDQLWRSATNGSESHTSALDEFNVRQLLLKDAVEALERGTDKDSLTPKPSMGWFGSYLSMTFLSSNASSSSDLGCGAVEMMHPVGGLPYRTLKADIFRGIVEGRAGVANFLRLVRAIFISAHLEDIGETELRLPTPREKNVEKSVAGTTKIAKDRPDANPKPPFVVCINEILKKKGLTHTLFCRALQNLSGPLKEALLLGTLVDVERHAEDPRTGLPFVDPEGFPNSYVRGSSLLYCRVGVQVEMSKDLGSTGVAKGIQMQAYAEPIIPEGGIAFGGPVTVRVIENEGQFREYVKDLKSDGSRRDWGATFLHAKPVTSVKAQTAATGTIESGSKESTKAAENGESTYLPSLGMSTTSAAFTDNHFHKRGYQAIELIRLANLTPLLWVRVDPHGCWSGRISIFQPDACLAECLFHDGDSSAQVDAIRALAERPLKIQATSKVTTIYDVNVSELPVRVLGDCLRGSPALHSSLPHTPTVRAQAALAIAQWQNNKAPKSKDASGPDSWVGLSLLIQCFRERFYSNGVVMPVKFTRLVLKKSEAEVAKEKAAAAEGAVANVKIDDTFHYLDTLADGEERAAALEDAEGVELEEDEEYRVRSSLVTAIGCIRAQDGQTPPSALRFLETVLEAEDAEMISNLVYPDEELMVEKAFRQMKAYNKEELDDEDEVRTPSLSFVSSMLVADALLALCHVNASSNVIMDPATGKPIPSSGSHPLNRLMEISRDWLDWELYRETIRNTIRTETCSGVSGNCHDIIAASAVLALSNLAILRQSTSDSSLDERIFSKDRPTILEAASAKFYIDIFDSDPTRNDLTRAACAQAVACIYCASDRFEQEAATSLGLLGALEFLFDRIIDEGTSPSLRQTLAAIMMDTCTGKVCSMQRVGAIAGRNDLIASAARFMTGPLGASHGGDNGSAIHTSVSAITLPAASTVNDGARRGLRLVGKAGHPKETASEATIARVAIFATRLWRTINGEPADSPEQPVQFPTGVCAYDGALRCSLLALWQWIWPRGCFAVLAVQSWTAQESTQRYKDIGAHLVMKISEEEKAEAFTEENSLADINRFVNVELDRQAWRGEMASKAYEIYKSSKGNILMQDVAAAEQGIGQPLPPIQRDAAFKQGGWIASAAQQRRAKALDGGTAVTKLRLTVKTSDA